MPQQPQPSFTQKEAKVQLAKNAIEQGQIQSQRRAAITYNTSRRTVQRRRDGILPRRDCTPNSKLLTDLEEEVL
jgi:hypothetical protein